MDYSGQGLDSGHEERDRQVVDDGLGIQEVGSDGVEQDIVSNLPPVPVGLPAQITILPEFADDPGVTIEFSIDDPDGDVITSVEWDLNAFNGVAGVEVSADDHQFAISVLRGVYVRGPADVHFEVVLHATDESGNRSSTPLDILVEDERGPYFDPTSRYRGQGSFTSLNEHCGHLSHPCNNLPDLQATLDQILGAGEQGVMKVLAPDEYGARYPIEPQDALAIHATGGRSWMLDCGYDRSSGDPSGETVGFAFSR